MCSYIQVFVMTTCQWILYNVEVCWKKIVRCQSKVGGHRQVCWPPLDPQELQAVEWGRRLRFATDVSNMSMTRFGYRVDLTHWLYHLRVKPPCQDCEQRNWLGWHRCWEICSLLDLEYLRRCCFVAMRRHQANYFRQT